MPSVSAYVENGVAMASDRGTVAWTFQLDFWGCCGQGAEELTAIRNLQRTLGRYDDVVVAERVQGDEQAFTRDRLPCTEGERRATLSVLAQVRPQTIALLRSCSEVELDWDDPERVLPKYAHWRTLRQMGWHISDTESRYYLPCLELGYRERAGELFDELELSADYVRQAVETMPAALVVEGEHGVWTSVKVLRRLAWHERSEFTVMQAILAKARLGRTFTGLSR